MHRPVLLVVALTAFGVLFLLTGTAHAQKRAALVIGNGAYQNVAPLQNPVKDAAAIAATFQNAGFEWVKLRRDLGNLEFKRALREFIDAATDADIAVIYYAGHGIQIRDMNYMIPVDAKLASEIDAEDEAVSLDRIVGSLEPAKRLRLVILDACRDNPFARTMKRPVAMRGTILGGLARMEPTLGDTLIAYAAKAGSTAEDGDEHSPFAAALLKHLVVPGLDIRLAFGRVRDDVMKATGNKQEPFVYGAIGGETVALVPAPAQSKALPSADVQRDFDVVRQIGTKRAWEIFIETHKTGLHVGLAREEIKRLEAAEQKPVVVAVEPAAPQKPVGPNSDERRASDGVKDSGDPGKLREFIANYPNSPLAETAGRAAETLERAAVEREEKARAEQEAALRGGLSPLAAADPKGGTEASCDRDGDKIARLAMSLGQGWAREDLKRLERNSACERVRAEAAALLLRSGAKAHPTGGSVSASEPADVPAERVPPPEKEPRGLVGAAQNELRRLGCFSGPDTGRFDADTKNALAQYFLHKGLPAFDVPVTQHLVLDLERETGRVCGADAKRGTGKPDTMPPERNRPEPSARSQAATSPKQSRRSGF